MILLLPEFLELTFSMTSVTTALQLKFCVRDVISAFRSIARFAPLKKMTSELTYGTLNVMNIY